MAYASTVTKNVGQGGLFEFVITETEAKDDDEVTISGVPNEGWVFRQVCALTAGTGSTVDPVLGIATNPSGANLVVANDTAAATVDNLQAGGVPYICATANTLYHRSVPNDTTADHSVTTRYFIVASAAKGR